MIYLIFTYTRGKMIKKNKKILLYPINQDIVEYVEPPSPSSKYNIPDWYKKLPKYLNNDKKFIFLKGQRNQTVKSCLPIVDAFTSGYTFSLPCDIQVVRDNSGNAIFNWAFNPPGFLGSVRERNLDSESKKACGWSNIHGYDELLFEWVPYWNIKTPRGYSSIFCHPINRVDLPFYTLGGVIDTDGWGDAGSHPFLLKSGWEGIIPKNTPIFQVIPFKRDNWESSTNKEMIKEYTKQINKRDSFLKDYYKNYIWKNKSYK